MRMWMPKIDEFRYAIWDKLSNGAALDISSNGEGNDETLHRCAYLQIPFDSFRIFGFLDDTGFRTTAPGIEARRTMGFFDDVQRSFYSGYFGHHGMKVQALTLPNGMFGSVYIGAIRVSDSGLLNMSGLDNYLCGLFREFNSAMETALNQFPVVYGDGIFPQLSTIVARYSHPNCDETTINRRMSSVRQSIEHIFGLHKKTFNLFGANHRFQLLVGGVEVSRLIFNSFFLFNCYTCFNESPNHFLVRPPTIDEYLPLDEDLKPAPIINDDTLGDVYNYHT